MNSVLKMGPRNWVILGILLALVVVGAGILFQSGSPENPGRAGEPPGLAADHSSAGHDWTPGTMQSYRISIVTDVRLDLAGMENNRQILQRISGALNMRVFGRENDQICVGFQLDPTDYTVNGQRDAGFEEGLSAPFVVLFEENGRPQSFLFPAALDKTERIILEEVVRTFQVVLPVERKSSWTVAEENATGRYMAYYHLLQDGMMQKQKTLYTEVKDPLVDNNPAKGSTVQLKKSLAAIRMMTDTVWIHDATIEETLLVSGGPGPSAESVMKAELVILPGPVNQKVALFGAGNWGEMLMAFSRQTPEPELDASSEGVLAGSSASSIDERFAQQVDQLNIGEKEGRIARLKILEKDLIANPDQAFHLIEYLDQAGITGATEAWLIHLLGRAGTPQAQQALVMVLDGPQYRDWNRVRAIVALGGVEQVTDEALYALQNMTAYRSGTVDKNLANTALLALGAIGKTLQETDPARADQIRADLTRFLQVAETDEEAGMVLKAMENMGDPSLVDTVSPYLDDGSPFVRRAAAQTLGKVHADDTLTLYTKNLPGEKDDQVRSAIVAGMKNLGNATPQSLKTVNGMILAEKVSDTRYLMAEYLGENIPAYPESIRTLQILALKDKSSRVRQHAAAMLIKNRNK